MQTRSFLQNVVNHLPGSCGTRSGGDEEAATPPRIYSETTGGAILAKPLILLEDKIRILRRIHHGAAARHPPGRMKMGRCLTGLPGWKQIPRANQRPVVS
jgi:hypothetical protein